MSDAEDFLRRVMEGEPLTQGPRTVYPELKFRIDAARTLLRHQEMQDRGAEPGGKGQLTLLEDVRL